MAFFAIHVPPGLSTAERRRASILGPDEVVARRSLVDLVTTSGFTVEMEEDLTAELVATAEALYEARARHADALREAEGVDAFDEEQGKKGSMKAGVLAGLLRRSLIVARKAGRPGTVRASGERGS